MTAVPIERRFPSLALAAAAVVIPIVLFGLPRVVFDGIYHGAHPPRQVQYLTFVAVFALQWAAYGFGVYCIGRLHLYCPRPATTFGEWFTAVTCGLFLVGIGAWCAFWSLAVGCMTLFWD